MLILEASASRPERGAAAAVVLAAVVLIASLTVGAATAATSRIRATSSDRWRPAHVYIAVGDRVVWTNPGDRRHDIAAYGGDWTFRRVLDPGESARFVFRAGRDGGRPYSYRCLIHSAIVDGVCRGMCGKVHVFTS